MARKKRERKGRRKKGAMDGIMERMRTNWTRKPRLEAAKDESSSARSQSLGSSWMRLVYVFVFVVLVSSLLSSSSGANTPRVS